MPKYKRRKTTDIIVVHCSATPADMDIEAEDIRRWHKNQGWIDIGYHFVITRAGQIQEGRPYMAQGAHAKGLNHCSVSVCMVGGVRKEKKGRKTALVPEQNFTNEQYRALAEILKRLKTHFDVPIVGHCDLDDDPRYKGQYKGYPKACPCFDVKEWVAKYGI